MGIWEEGIEMPFSNDKDLQRAFAIAHGKLSAKIVVADFELIQLTFQETYKSELRDVICDVLKSKAYCESPYQTAFEYRDIYNMLIKEGFDVEHHLKCIVALLKNNLIFGDYRAGENDTCYYLCAELDDKYLPWDTTQFDW